MPPTFPMRITFAFQNFISIEKRICTVQVVSPSAMRNLLSHGESYKPEPAPEPELESNYSKTFIRQRSCSLSEAGPARRTPKIAE